MTQGVILTVGHSTHALDDFLALLNAHRVEALADVRRFPASRRYPHFNRDVLAERLAAVGIAYTWIAELGGRRAPRPDSHNTSWRNRSFRGYADYMETPAFRAAIERLEAIAAEKTAAILCAEALWWRCHRSLIADYLTARDRSVAHILDASTAEPHRYTKPARIVDGALSYAESRLI
jgi:uncharacterized protein (DUF488 family)